MAHFIEGRGFNKGNCFAVPEVRLTKTVYKFAFSQGSVSFLVVFVFVFALLSVPALCLVSAEILAKVLITSVLPALWCWKPCLLDNTFD